MILESMFSDGEVAERVRGRLSPSRFAKPFLVMGIAFYLVFHLIVGDRGLYALFKEERHLEILQGELKQVSAQKTLLTQRVKLLSSGSLDLDMLDEQARRELGYSSPDEVVILK